MNTHKNTDSLEQLPSSIKLKEHNDITHTLHTAGRKFETNWKIHVFLNVFIEDFYARPSSKENSKFCANFIVWNSSVLPPYFHFNYIFCASNLFKIVSKSKISATSILKGFISFHSSSEHEFTKKIRRHQNRQ